MFRHLLTLSILAAMALSLSACVIEPAGGGGGNWCYYHPYRCR